MSYKNNISQLNIAHKFFKLMKQFIPFCIIGACNTIIDLIILNTASIIVEVSEGMGLAIIKCISFLSAVIFSYFANKYWTFKGASKKNTKIQFSQFLITSIIGMLINVSTTMLVLSYLKIPINNMLQLTFLTDIVWINISALSGTVVGLLWNFIGYKVFVFKK